MEKLYIDVMTMMWAKFYCTLIYTYCPLFKIDIDDVARFVYQKRPTLRYRKDVVLIFNEKPSHETENNYRKITGQQSQRGLHP